MTPTNVKQYAVPAGKEPTDVHPLTSNFCQRGVTLTQDPDWTLRIESPLKADDWQKLLDMLTQIPDVQISELIVSKQTFDAESRTWFASCIGQMPALQSLHLAFCKMPAGEVNWPPLTNLHSLHLECTTQSHALLMHVLETSTLTTLFFRGARDIDREGHSKIAESLGRRQSELRKLTLRNLPAGAALAPVLDTYASSFLEHQTTLACLDLSENPLTECECTRLWEALQKKSTLTTLALAGCWTYSRDALDAKALAHLVSLENLVSLDLSGNDFLASAMPVFEALAAHPRLEHLDLYSAGMDDPLIDALATVLKSNNTLVSLKLGDIGNKPFATLTKAMAHNHSLRTLSIQHLENICSTMATNDIGGQYSNYLALMACVDRNRRKWENLPSLIEGGMRVFLGSMKRQNPDDPISLERVPYDIAGYAAQIARERNGEGAMAVTLLNKMAYSQGVRALERKNEARMTQPDAS
jgi:hypothetical protein